MVILIAVAVGNIGSAETIQVSSVFTVINVIFKKHLQNKEITGQN